MPCPALQPLQTPEPLPSALPAPPPALSPQKGGGHCGRGRTALTTGEPQCPRGWRGKGGKGSPTSLLVLSQLDLAVFWGAGRTPLVLVPGCLPPLCPQLWVPEPQDSRNKEQRDRKRVLCGLCSRWCHCAPHPCVYEKVQGPGGKGLGDRMYTPPHPVFQPCI